VTGQLSTLVKRLAPEPIKPALLMARRVGRGVIASLGTPFRVRAYRTPEAWWLRGLPAPLRRVWRVEVAARGSRRIEGGSGYRPLPGFIHVDINPDAFKLDLLVRGQALPFRDSWADEVMNVHMIEHIPPATIRATFREWFRVLRGGGELQIHTPNGETFGRELVASASGDSNSFWVVQDALFGYYLHPTECTGPERFGERGDHRTLFTFPPLRSLLEEVGFSGVEDISGENPCSNWVEWSPYISRPCLEVRALKAGADLTKG
jgi:SAM-dependent methyltransferase